MAFLPSHEQVQKVTGIAISKSNKYAAFIEEVQDSDVHQVWIGINFPYILSMMDS